MNDHYSFGDNETFLRYYRRQSKCCDIVQVLVGSWDSKWTSDLASIDTSQIPFDIRCFLFYLEWALDFLAYILNHITVEFSTNMEKLNILMHRIFVEDWISTGHTIVEVVVCVFVPKLLVEHTSPSIVSHHHWRESDSLKLVEQIPLINLEGSKCSDRSSYWISSDD